MDCKVTVQEFYQALETGALLSMLEKTRQIPGGKKRIREIMSRGGLHAAFYQNIQLFPSNGMAPHLRDSEANLCFELEREGHRRIMIPLVQLENLVEVGVTEKQFESVQKDLKYSYNRRYEKVAVKKIENLPF